MSQINQIQEELRQIEGRRFQTLANQYLYRRYSLNNIIELGSQCGTDKIHDRSARHVLRRREWTLPLRGIHNL